jgi:hypothetical protein
MQYSVQESYIARIKRIYSLMVGTYILGSLFILYLIHGIISDQFLAIMAVIQIFWGILCFAFLLRRPLLSWNDASVELLEDELDVLKQKKHIRVPFKSISRVQFVLKKNGDPLSTRIYSVNSHRKLIIPALNNQAHFCDLLKSKIDGHANIESISVRLPIEGPHRTFTLTLISAIYLTVALQVLMTVATKFLRPDLNISIVKLIIPTMMALSIAISLSSAVLLQRKAANILILLIGASILFINKAALPGVFSGVTPSWYIVLFWIYNGAVLAGIFSATFLLFNPVGRPLHPRTPYLWLTCGVSSGLVIAWVLMFYHARWAQTSSEHTSLAAAGPWAEVVRKDFDFAISFPGTPVEAQAPDLGTGGHSLRVQVARTALYEIDYASIPSVIRPDNAAIFFDRVRDSQVKAIQNRKVSVEVSAEKSFSVDGFPARDYTIIPSGYPATHARLILVGQKFYRMRTTFVGNSSDAGQFFSSFHFFKTEMTH